MNLELFKTTLDELELPKYRYEQAVSFYYQKLPKNWSEMKILPKFDLERIAAKMSFSTVSINKTFESDDVIKIVFQMNDGGQLVEGVIMKHLDGRRTLCLSCQAGCPMGCYFCATGTMGLKKNLSAYEITDMVREASIFLNERKEKITNIVYMGMGEPLSNYLPVKKSIELLHDPKRFNMGWRHISVSTCGVVPKIMEFAKDFPQVNLAISLHAANDIKRSQLMPINDRFNLVMLMKTCAEYTKLTKRKLFFEYLVIDKFNDQLQDVIELKKLLNHKLYHLNLIRYHYTTATAGKYGVTWKAPSRASLDNFMKDLNKYKIPYTLRRSFGEKIDAACGMLALKETAQQSQQGA